MNQNERKAIMVSVPLHERISKIAKINNRTLQGQLNEWADKEEKSNEKN